ncbi:MAG: hypothetical protein NZ889_00915 [Candidatus Pacearchaeota archaeon]|nr:hypothetical protein [Candidatus Pacearchaeota archaeon]
MKKKRGKKSKASGHISFEDRLKKPVTEVHKEKIILLLFLLFVVLALIIMFKQPLEQEQIVGRAVSGLELEKTKFDAGENLQGKITLALHPEDILPQNTTLLITILTNASKCPTRYVCADGSTVPWYVFNLTTQQCQLARIDPEGDCCIRQGANCKEGILNKNFNPNPTDPSKVERWVKLFSPSPSSFDLGAVGTEEVVVGADEEGNPIFSSAVFLDTSLQLADFASGRIILNQNIAPRNFKISDLGPPTVPPPQQPQQYCDDSDRGRNYTSRGTCKDPDGIYNDGCTGFKFVYLIEWFCNTTTNKCQPEIMFCPHGCVDGRCLSSPPQVQVPPPQVVPCDDSDGGRNYTSRGTCKDPDGIYNDTCEGLPTSTHPFLREWFCNTTTNKCQYEIISCLYGCVDGRCLSSPPQVSHPQVVTGAAITGQAIQSHIIPYQSLKWAVAWQDVLGEGKNCAFEVIVRSNNRSLHYYYKLNNVCSKPSDNTTDKYIELAPPTATQDPYDPLSVYWKIESRDLYSDWKSKFGAQENDVLVEIQLVSHAKKVDTTYYNQRVWWDYIKLNKYGYTEPSDSCIARGKKCCAKETGFGNYFGDQLKCPTELGETECWSSCTDFAHLTLTQFIRSSDARTKYNTTEGECQFVKDGQVISLNDYCYPGYAGRGYTACLNTGSNAPINCRNWDNTYTLFLNNLALKAPNQSGSYILKAEFFYTNQIGETIEIFSRSLGFIVGDVIFGGGGAVENWECSPWSSCINGIQFTNCTEIQTGRREVKNRTCCWACSEWQPAECPENRTQTRTCILSMIDECPIQSAEKPNEMQSCEPSLQPCTEEDWRCVDDAKCINGIRRRMCEKIRPCDEATGYVPDTEIECRKGFRIGGLTIYIVIVAVAAAVAILLLLKILKKPTKKQEKKARYPEVVSYIKEALAAGASRKEIETKLLEAGWPKDIIDESFGAAGFSV